MRLRPGSLTTLAVLLFTAAGFCLLSAIGLVLGQMMPRHHHQGRPDPFLPVWFVPCEIAASLVIAGLMVVAGIGCLRQGRWLGRWGGTVYAITALAWTGVVIAVLQANHQLADIGLMTLVGALLPLATLVWLHLILPDVWRSAPSRPRPGTAAEVPVALPGWTARLRLHTAYALRQALRGAGGLILTLTLLASGLLTVQVVVSMDRLGGERLRGAYPLGVTTLLRGYFQADNDLVIDYAGWANHLTIDQLPVVSCCWLALLALMPVLAPFGTFNLVAADAQRRGFRFLLLRSDRTSIYLGRFLAAALLTTTVLLLLLACTAAYLGLTVAGCGWRTLAMGALWTWGACAVAALPFLALTAWISAAIPSGLGTLVMAHALIAVVPGMAFALASQWTPLWHLMHLLPWGVLPLLLHPEPLVAGLAALACLGYTAILLWCGLRHFIRRDL